MRIVMTTIAFVVGFYILVCVAALVFQSSLVFFPDRRIVATPADIGLDYEDVFIKTSDGERVHGWFVRGEKRWTVLFFHGNAGNISHRLDSIRIFHSLGVSVLVIDYRGYGRSEGRMSEQGSYRDAEAAYRFLIDDRNIDADDIVFFGRSLGSAVAIELATRFRPAALIAESCFTSLADVGARHYRLLPVKLLTRIRYDCVPRVEMIDCPKLFIHSPGDELLPFHLAQKLYETAAEPKQFMELQGDHNSGFLTMGPRYVNGLREFLNAAGMSTGE
jgi:fermentation-respiration switch protein FrsA (DUF1100 family)